MLDHLFFLYVDLFWLCVHVVRKIVFEFEFKRNREKEKK
jgi:hypothetical protein